MPIPQPAPAPDTQNLHFSMLHMQHARWKEHRLPDGAIYWTRPFHLQHTPAFTPAYDIVEVVTDIDLREPETVHRLNSFLLASAPNIGEEIQKPAPLGQPAGGRDSGRELWVTAREDDGNPLHTPMPSTSLRGSISGAHVKAFKIVWLDHYGRGLKEGDNDRERAAEISDDIVFRKSKPIPDDGRIPLNESCPTSGMAVEYAYWSFVETHPLHRTASHRDQEDALEFLAWCFTDTLFTPNGKPSTVPFTREECRELLDLFRSIDRKFSSPGFIADEMGAEWSH